MSVNITRRTEQNFNGKFVAVHVVDGQIITVSFNKSPASAEAFEIAANELQEIRKVLWPNYVDAATNHIVISAKEPKHHGKIKWFNDAKGFGFIEEDVTKRAVFVHFTSIQREGFRSLAEGERVSFEFSEGPKGLTAQNVVPIVQPQ